MVERSTLTLGGFSRGVGGTAAGSWVASQVLKYEEQTRRTSVCKAAECQAYPLTYLPCHDFDGQERTPQVT